MKLLKAGDPCPCCGRPIPEGLSAKRMLFLSWFAEGVTIVAEKAGRDITDDVLRGVLQGEVTLDIKGWRQIGKALDKLAAAGEGDGG